MVRSSNTRGSSLIEVIVFSSILMGLMAILTLFLVKGKRYFFQTESYAFAQREATKVLRRVADDLYQASETHLVISSGQLYFLSCRPGPGEPPVELSTSDGGILWKRWVSYYWDGATKEVYRGNIPLTTAISDLTLTPNPAVVFDDFRTLSSPAPERVGRGVYGLTFVRPSNRVYDVEITTRFVGASPKAPRKPYAEVKLKSTIRIPALN